MQTIQNKKSKLENFRTDLYYAVFKKTKKYVMNELENAERKIKEQDEGCFITTAVCESLGKPDDCYELTTFRKFRDTWLINQPDGRALIKEYYEIAPKIVANISRLADAAQIYQGICQNYLKPCLENIEAGRLAECKKIYVTMVKQLKKIYVGE